MTALDKNGPLTAERLREVLSYDPETGIFRWLYDHCSVKAGDVAGCPEAKGYLRISVDGRRYKAHRLAWLHYFGVWPDKQVGHRNTIKSENWIDNLREGGNAQNCANAETPKNNSTGFKGVARSGERFAAGIKVNYRRAHLGSFDTPEEAAAAYDAAAIQAWGEFARPNNGERKYER
jgi:hypothetical protein